MLSLSSRQNGFRILLPKNYLMPEIEEKYSLILQQKKGFYNSAIEFLNESIQRVELFGFTNAAMQQMQSATGVPALYPERIQENQFLYPSSEYNYRSAISPLTLIDKTFSIEFRHIAGYLNYFMVFENFWYQYTRDYEEKDLCRELEVEVYDEHGVIYSKVKIYEPVINGMDMIAFDYTNPNPSPMTFKVEYKYSNFDIYFLTDFLHSDRYDEDDMDESNLDGSSGNNINCK